MRIKIRRGRPDESDALTQIAHAAKRHWGYPEQWVSAWRGALTLTPDELTNHQVYLAVEGKLPVGFYALTGSGSRLVLEHLWVSPRCLGAGVGRKLFQHAVKTATKLNASVIEIESDPNAEGFYVRMGARRVGETLWEIEGQVRFLPRLIFEIRRHVE